MNNYMSKIFTSLFLQIIFLSGYIIAQNSRPNILWISCEDISPRLRCYGDTVAETPNLDRLAREGMRFENVITTSPVCAPVRTGIITGMYPTSIGGHNMRTTHKGSTGGLPTPYFCVPPHFVKAFPEYLRKAGYYCTNNVKTDYQFGNQKTIWDESSRHAHYKNRPDKNQPFFAVFNLTLTHESQNWEPGDQTDHNLVEVPPYYPDTEKVRKSIARSYDNIRRMDSIAGSYLKELSELGYSENTIVFFWSDHGDGMPRGKRWLYDSGTRIPVIIRWPGVTQPGSINDELVSTVDFAPTVLSMAGVDVPLHMQGRIVLGNKKEAEPRFVFSHRDRFDEAYDMVRSVRSRKYLYIRNYYPSIPYIIWVPYRNRSPIMQELFRFQRENRLNEIQKLWMASTRPPIEFYDIVNDPYQINNLANDENYKERIADMGKILDEWRLRTKDLGDYSESELLKLWWNNGKQPETHKPVLIPNDNNNPGLKHVDSNIVELNSPSFITLHSPTQGASITYTMQNGEDSDWKIYKGPINLQRGTTTLRAIACRYGYTESEEMKCKLIVN